MTEGKDLDKVDGRSSSITRGEDGLLPDQTTWIEAWQRLGYSGACDATTYSRARVRRWLREDEAFLAYYNRELKGSKEATKRRMIDLAEVAADELLDLMHAEKPYKVVIMCTKCATKNEKTIQVRDSSVRAKVIEMVLKSAEILKEVRKEEKEITIKLSLDERLAYARLNAGWDISEQKRRRFLEIGLILPSGEINPDIETVEGEFREVD